MSIETDIKQRTFRSPYHRLTVNLIYTANWLLHKQTGLFRAFDLSPQQYNVLRILRGSAPVPVKVSEITERMLDKTSNVSRLVDKLLEKNLVERKSCPSDRRAVHILITGKGLEVLKEIDPLTSELESTLYNLDSGEADELSRLLDKLRSAST